MSDAKPHLALNPFAFDHQMQDKPLITRKKLLERQEHLNRDSQKKSVL